MEKKNKVRTCGNCAYLSSRKKIEIKYMFVITKKCHILVITSLVVLLIVLIINLKTIIIMSKLSKAIANAIIEFNAGLLTQDELFDKLERDIDNVNIKVWREDKSVPLPTYGKEGDACCDVYAKSIEYDADKDRFIIHTGLHFALPDEYEMELHPRSSNTKTDFYMPNSPGTLDWGYRGELLVIFKNRTSHQLIRIISNFENAFNNIVKRIDNDAFNSITYARQDFDKLNKREVFPYKKGDRVCQLLVRRREKITWDEVETLEELGTTERGVKGFGSTGK